VQDTTTYKIDDLARAAGTSARTVRYYVQRGLIPAPAFKGKDTAYGHEHLVRLRAIRKMQDAFFPLDAIAVELERRSLDEIENIADGKELPQLAPVAPVAPSAQGGGGGVVPASVPSPVQVPDPHDPNLIVITPMPFLPGHTLPSTTKGERVLRRIEIAPGVELTIADDAPLASRRLAEKILREL
jgi:DNA-binding transcriptional MerR regulator